MGEGDGVHFRECSTPDAMSSGTKAPLHKHLLWLLLVLKQPFKASIKRCLFGTSGPVDVECFCHVPVVIDCRHDLVEYCLLFSGSRHKLMVPTVPLRLFHGTVDCPMQVPVDGRSGWTNHSLREFFRVPTEDFQWPSESTASHSQRLAIVVYILSGSAGWRYTNTVTKM